MVHAEHCHYPLLHIQVVRCRHALSSTTTACGWGCPQFMLPARNQGNALNPALPAIVLSAAYEHLVVWHAQQLLKPRNMSVHLCFHVRLAIDTSTSTHKKSTRWLDQQAMPQSLHRPHALPFSPGMTGTRHEHHPPVRKRAAVAVAALPRLHEPLAHARLVPRLPLRGARVRAWPPMPRPATTASAPTHHRHPHAHVGLGRHHFAVRLHHIARARAACRGAAGRVLLGAAQVGLAVRVSAVVGLVGAIAFLPPVEGCARGREWNVKQASAPAHQGWVRILPSHVHLTNHTYIEHRHEGMPSSRHHTLLVPLQPTCCIFVS